MQKNGPQELCEPPKKTGDDEIRTHDPHNAIVMLFQLSYVPLEYAAYTTIFDEARQYLFFKIISPLW